MPVPKRKTSKRRRDQRQSTKFIRPQAITKCSQCGEPNLPHQACMACGYYKGRKVLTTKNDRGVVREEVRAKVAQRAAEKNKDDHGHSHDDGHDHDHSHE